jgi:hypothetical protein
MQINDRLMTLVTGAVLAIGGATASLFLGEDAGQEAPPQTIVVASLATPSIPTASDVAMTRVDTDAIVADAPAQPDMPAKEDAAIAGVEAELIFAAVEPAKRAERDDAGTDLSEVAVLAEMPALAMPQDFSDITLTRTPAAFDTPSQPRVASNLPDLTFNIADLVKIPTVAQASCALDIRATPIFGARVTLKLIALCHPNVVVTIKHGGLQFKERLDADGAIELKIPAFAEYSRFDIELADGTTSTVGAYIAGLSALERVGIAWAGENDTFLHALQNGADIGDAGHIWRVNPNSFAKSRMNGGGYLVALGDPSIENAQLAQVYTLPQRAEKRAQIVELQIETLRADTACGGEMALRLAHHRVNSGAAQSKLSLNLPVCGADETSLLLKNTIKDMKVARK